MGNEPRTTGVFEIPLYAGGDCEYTRGGAGVQRVAPTADAFVSLNGENISIRIFSSSDTLESGNVMVANVEYKITSIPTMRAVTLVPSDDARSASIRIFRSLSVSTSEVSRSGRGSNTPKSTIEL